MNALVGIMQNLEVNWIENFYLTCCHLQIVSFVLLKCAPHCMYLTNSVFSLIKVEMLKRNKFIIIIIIIIIIIRYWLE